MTKNSGFTLIELMIVIAIIGVISAIAVPNMIAWRANHQLSGSAREVLSAINGARLEAVKNNAFVTVTFDTGARVLTTVITNRVSGVDRTITTPLKPDVDIDSAVFSGSNAFRFNSRGLPVKLADNNFASGTVTLTNAKGDSLEVIMASTGVTRIDKP